MGKIKDITGMRSGRLVAVSFAGVNKKRYALWECKCDCGNTTIKESRYITGGYVISCGCAIHSLEGYQTTHGMSKTPIYKTWCGIKDRCLNPKNTAYPSYGGRGISICERWMKFENFYEDMGDRPEGMSLDRIDNDQGYSKENCRWATQSIQTYNRRKHKTTGSSKAVYKGVHYFKRDDNFMSSVMIDGDAIYLGKSTSNLLLGLRYDAALSLSGRSEFNNRSMGLLDETLEDRFPCDFTFWNEYVPKIPQPLKFV